MTTSENTTKKEAKKEMKTCTDATKIPNLNREGPRLPSVTELLQKGTSNEDGKKKTFWQSIKEPMMLLAIFVVTLAIFHKTVLTRPRRIAPFVLPQNKPGFEERFGKKN